MTTKRYGVFGNPVAHSKSPEIHLLFAQQEGVTIQYDRFLAPLDGFAQAAHAAFDAGLQGANVTVPFKLDAFALAQEHAPRAQSAQAANTLIVLGEENGQRYFRADNTDGPGIVHDITQHLKLPIAQKRVLILGAGGAARGIIHPIIEAGAAHVALFNRTPEKAEELAKDFDIEARPRLPESGFDIIINATSASLAQDRLDVPTSLFSGSLLAYDMMYAAQPTAFLQEAKAAGAAHVCDGLGMLVSQAAFSYQLWRQFMPQTAEVLAAMRQSLQ